MCLRHLHEGISLVCIIIVIKPTHLDLIFVRHNKHLSYFNHLIFVTAYEVHSYSLFIYEEIKQDIK
jgi:hypothetical protein